MKSAVCSQPWAALAIVMALAIPNCNRNGRANAGLQSAISHIARGDDASAEIELKNVLSARPGDPAALKQLGLLLLRQGAACEAGRILAAARERQPDDDETAIGLAMAYYQLGFIGDSRKVLLELTERTPGHGEALFLLAETSFTPEATAESVMRLDAADLPDSTDAILARALIDLRGGRTDEAAALIDRVLRVAPDCSRAHALRGVLHNSLSQPEKALDSLRKAATLAGPRSAESMGLASELLRQNRSSEAEELLRRAAATTPPYLPALRMLARISMAANNDDAATRHLARVLARCPLDIEAGVIQSDIWIRGKQPGKAVEQMQKLVMSYPNRPQLELMLGKASLAADDAGKAVAAFDRALSLDPRMTDAIMLRAAMHIREGKPAEAIRILAPLSAEEPRNRAAAELLVRALRAENRDEEALAILRKQDCGETGDDSKQLMIGRILSDCNRPDEARAAFERGIQLSPDSLACVSQLVALDQQEGKINEATARTDGFLATHPESAEANILKAGLCLVQGDLKKSETFARRAVELDPRDPMSHRILVETQIASGRSSHAVDQLRQQLKETPDNISARMQLGTLLLQLGHLEEARICFEQTTILAPEFPHAYSALAFVTAEISGDMEKALEHAGKARSLAPGDPVVADTLGWLLWRRGSFGEALPLLQQAAADLPQVPTFQYHLAMTYHRMGRHQQARGALEKALASGMAFPEESAARLRLSLIRTAEGASLPELEAQASRHPDDLPTFVLLGEKLAAAGRHEESATAFRHALGYNPGLETALVGLAHLYAKHLDQPEKSLEAAMAARRAAPQSPRTAAALGLARFLTGSHEDAYNLLREAAGALPEDHDIQEDYSWAAYATGRVGLARETIARMIPEGPENANDLGTFLELTGPDPARALTARNRGPDLPDATPYDVPALMARASQQAGDGVNPAAVYTRILEILPLFDPARLALARIYLDDPARLDAAEELAVAARARLKEDTELGGLLALINYRKGRHEYAVQLLSELASKRQLSGSELFAMGMSQVAANRPAEALQSLSLALKSGLPEADARTASTALDKLTNPEARSADEFRLRFPPP